MNSFAVYFDPDGIDELEKYSPFNLRRDIRKTGMSDDELESVAQIIADELYYGIHRPPTTVRLFENRRSACVKVRTVDVKRDSGKSNGYRCILLVDQLNFRAFLLHIYRHGHGEDKNISNAENNQLKKLVKKYNEDLENYLAKK